MTHCEGDRRQLYDITNDKDILVNGVRNTMIRSENSGNIKGLAEVPQADVIKRSRKSDNADHSSNESLSRPSSFTSSSSYGEAEVESYGQYVAGDANQSTRKRKTPMTRSCATDHDLGYDTMIGGSKTGHTQDDDDWRTSRTEDDVIKVSRLQETPADRKHTGQTNGENCQEDEFTKGLRCSDVQTALRILKTRYRLRDVQAAKRSASDVHWNMATNFRPNYGRIGSYCRSKRSLYYASEPLQEMSKKIFIRDLELEETLRRILAADGETLEPRHQDQLQGDKEMDDESSDDNKSILRDSQARSQKGKHTTFAPNTPDTRGPNGEKAAQSLDEQDGPQRKKPRRNVLQRAARALRKRITG